MLQNFKIRSDHLVRASASRRKSPLKSLLLKREAHRRKIKLAILPTSETIKALQKNPDETNAILRVTC